MPTSFSDYRPQNVRKMIAYEVEIQQPEALRAYFQDRLELYRKESNNYPMGADPIYQKDVKA